MVYVEWKTINGHKYAYLKKSFRDKDGKVRTKHVRYLGKVSPEVLNQMGFADIGLGSDDAATSHKPVQTQGTQTEPTQTEAITRAELDTQAHMDDTALSEQDRSAREPERKVSNSILAEIDLSIERKMTSDAVEIGDAIEKGDVKEIANGIKNKKNNMEEMKRVGEIGKQKEKERTEKEEDECDKGDWFSSLEQDLDNMRGKKLDKH